MSGAAADAWVLQGGPLHGGLSDPSLASYFKPDPGADCSAGVMLH